MEIESGVGARQPDLDPVLKDAAQCPGFSGPTGKGTEKELANSPKPGEPEEVERRRSVETGGSASVQNVTGHPCWHRKEPGLRPGSLQCDDVEANRSVSRVRSVETVAETALDGPDIRLVVPTVHRLVSGEGHGRCGGTITEPAEFDSGVRVPLRRYGVIG